MNNEEIIIDYLRTHAYARLRPKAALLDMDGTLYDSMKNHAQAWVQMCHERGLEADPLEIYMNEGRTGSSTINNLMQRTYDRNATEDEIQAMYKRKSDLFNLMPKVSPMPGAAQLLRELEHGGIKRVLVTGSGQGSLISRLSADFPGAFHPGLMITAANTEHSKPHPDPYLKAMALAHVEPWEAIAFENAPLGVESASRSGAFTVAVSTGPIPKEALAEAGASIVYDSMEDCARLFPALLRQMYKITLS